MMPASRMSQVLSKSVDCVQLYDMVEEMSLISIEVRGPFNRLKRIQYLLSRHVSFLEGNSETKLRLIAIPTVGSSVNIWVTFATLVDLAFFFWSMY